ncbi:50S ribosomal protein L22 [Gammaproteobacteria bacterium]|nr:50S ribosomal protein L22 [Gammaproteobacteria bacterium]
MTQSKLNNQRSSVKKMNLAAKLIRGKDVRYAQSVLAFSDQKSARVMLKVLKSAVANAENNQNLDSDGLYVSAVQVNKGPTLKRWRARAKGSSARILKRSVHIVIKLAEKIGE